MSSPPPDESPPEPADPPDQTGVLLQRWHDGSQEALSALLERDLPWIRAHVTQRLGSHLRDKMEVDDVVQEAMIDVLRYGPKFVMSDRRQFRSLMAQIIENNLRDSNDWARARKRAAENEKPVPSDTMLNLDMPMDAVTRPSEAFVRQQNASWTRLAMELLDPGDRQIIRMRHWEKMSFEAIAQAIGTQANTARMRFQRALPRLAAKISQVQQGSFGGE